MKVAVQCESPLLQRSLELFLAAHLSSLKHCDVVIRDRQINDGYKSLYVGTSPDADLVKPFSRSQLMLLLDQMSEDEEAVQEIQEITEEIGVSEKSDEMDFSILEKRIEKLTQEYQANILKAVRTFYEG
ncbi:MAG: hypothetical protein U9Q62_11015 [Campylobacterota bacterium]|nr:hypothetical protein [Campylobacterota bacterium]